MPDDTNNNTIRSEKNVSTAPAIPPSQDPGVTESSWGDRWKHTVFSATVYFGFNYIVNTLFSVSVAYLFERKFKGDVRTWADSLGRSVAKFTKGDAAHAGDVLFSGSRGLILTGGGTVLVPVLKTAEDHRHKMEFKIGHALDVIQDKLGMGNSATQKNLADYQTIHKAIEKGAAADVSAEDLERFKIDHHIQTDKKGRLEFAEHKAPWSKILLARAAAWIAAFSTNAGLEHLAGLDKKVLERMSPSVSAAISKRLPVYNKLKDPDLFSKNLINDAMLTVSSSITQVVVQKGLMREKPVPETVAPADKTPADSPDAKSTWSNNRVKKATPTGGYASAVEDSPALENSR